MIKRLALLWIGLVIASTGLAQAPASPMVVVQSFSPQGEIKAVRQVRARFAMPMVALGDPREATPFDIDCAEPGTGRWADARNWVFDFERDLPAGVRCHFAVKGGLLSLDGTALPTGQRFAFSTGGPAILRSLPEEGDERVDEHQSFILGLDAPAKPASISAHAYCTAAGVNERIGVRLISGQARKALLDQRRSFAGSYLRLLILDANRGETRSIAFRLPENGSDEEKFRRLRDAPDSPLVTLACARTLPQNVEVKLVWGAGIESLAGVATTEAQSIAYKVRPGFRASFSCERVNRNAQCVPIMPMTLSFTAPVARSTLGRIRLVDAAGKRYEPVLPKADGNAAADEVTFGPGLPERQSFRIELPVGVVDDAGRRLGNAAAFPMRVRTDEAPPLAKFAADFGILERVLPDRAMPTLPVTLRNVEATLKGALVQVPRPRNAETPPLSAQVARVAPGEEMKIIEWRRRLEDADRIEREYDEANDRWTTRYNGHVRSMFKAGETRVPLSLPKPGGGKAFEVVGIPLPKAGFYIVELASPRLGAALNGNGQPFFVRSAALVTDLGVHFKLGRESSLVWVTRLSDGEPVRNARVEVRDCAGVSYWQGATDPAGIARIARELPQRARLPACNKYEREYFVTARVDGDMAFALSSWGEGIGPWRFDVPTGNEGGDILVHAVVDRPLFRAGESASMKIFVRKPTAAGFALVPAAALGDTLTIRHIGSEREYAVPVHWRDAASGDATFDIPRDAALGTYEISILDTLGGTPKPAPRLAGRLRVEAFRVPLMRARLQAVGAPLVGPAEAPIDLQVAYLSGGGAGGLAVKLRAELEPRPVAFADFPGYTFAGGDVVETGPQSSERPLPSDDEAPASMGDSDEGDEGDTDASNLPRRERLADLALTLDAAGGGRAVVKTPSASDVPRDLVAELEYRDPNGETLTSASRIPLWPSRVLLGIKADSWVASKDRVTFTVAAVDLQGRSLPDVSVETDAFRRETYSHRRRLLGGFYAYEHGSEIKRLGDLCAGRTDAHGLLVCDVAAPGAGNLVVRARARDTEGRGAVARADVWVATGEDWWYAASDNDRIDLLPEKKRYEPGDTARFQVRTPFAHATALVTVEREGVLESFVRPLDRSDPVIEVPIKGSYAPNVFVSAFIVRGRIAGVTPTALVDLAKPSFRMGLAEVRVGWAAHELDVKVVPAAFDYKVREKALVNVTVRRPDGRAPPSGSELALAAVDEGLLELLPNDSWKLLDAMMSRRGEQVETSTAAMQVIGRRHFGRKAVATGGGGGRQSARELFDTLLLWKARIPLDAAGNATVEVPLNDSLTSFRIVAIASSGAGLFGTGSASIRASQDLMVLSGLPPVVREGDRFRAGVTVRNASQRRIAALVTATVQAEGETARAKPPPLRDRSVELAPGEAREMNWDVSVPVGSARLRWQIGVDESDRADDGAARARDRLRVAQRVDPAVPERTLQATMFQLDGPRAVEIQQPADALPGRGGLDVLMQAKLGSDLPAVREYLARYPYSCFEQRASVAIGLRDADRWSALMRALPDYLDRDGMVKFWPILRNGDDSLTAYALSVARAAGWEIPEALRTRMEQALIGFVEGRVVRDSALRTSDLAIRKVAALEALSRRAEPLEPRWMDSIAVEPNLWPTSAVIDWYLVQKRSPRLPKRAERLQQAEQILRSRLNFQGTSMGFSTERTDALWWLMVSADSNANRLLLAMIDDDGWREDVPRLVRGTLGRMQGGRWNTTVANAWGTLALDRFAAAFEREKVAGTTSATLAGRTFAHAWQPDAGAQPVRERFAWPPARAAVSLAQEGNGRPWVTLRSVAAVPLTQMLSSGYRITRDVTPVEQKLKGAWSRGDVARVRIAIDAQADMTWVVVDDPLPAGATAIGRGLGGESTIQVRDDRRPDFAAPTFEERNFEAYRAYFRFVPKGRFVVEYTMRFDNPGVFHLPATHVEAMYAPEMFGDLPNADVEVRE